MQNRTLIAAFVLSASVHAALILSNFPIISNFPIEDGSNHMSISMGSIVINGEKNSKPRWSNRNSETADKSLVETNETRNRPAISGQVPSLFGRSGAEKDNSGKAKNQYFTEIRKRIEKAKRYPDLAQIRGIEGTSRVGFIITKAGKVEKADLMRSSNFQILDDEAVATIKRASPFPPIPDEFGKAQIKLTIPIVFELRGGGATP